MKYKLTDIFDLQMGKTPDRSNLEYWNSGTEEWISIADLSRCGKYITETKEKITKSAVEESKIKCIPENTVIMSFKLSIGKLAITEREMYSNEAIMAFIDKKIVGIVPSYLYYLFMHKDWNEGTNKAVMGKTLNKATLSQMSIEIHEVKEQQKIVRLLDTVYQLIEGRKKQLEELDNLIKSQFIEMFGKCELKLPIGDLCSIKARIGWQGLTKKEYLISGDYQLITGVDFKAGKIDFEKCFFVTQDRYEQDENIKVRVGDVLVTKDGTIGKVAIVDKMSMPATLNSGVFVVRDQSKKLNNIFLVHALLSDDFKRFIDNIKIGATIAHLNQGAFVKYEIPVPPIELQNQFATFVQQVDKLKFEI